MQGREQKGERRVKRGTSEEAMTESIHTEERVCPVGVCVFQPHRVLVFLCMFERPRVENDSYTLE